MEKSWIRHLNSFLNVPRPLTAGTQADEGAVDTLLLSLWVSVCL